MVLHGIRDTTQVHFFLKEPYSLPSSSSVYAIPAPFISDLLGGRSKLFMPPLKAYQGTPSPQKIGWGGGVTLSADLTKSNTQKQNSVSIHTTFSR